MVYASVTENYQLRECSYLTFLQLGCGLWIRTPIQLFFVGRRISLLLYLILTKACQCYLSDASLRCPPPTPADQKTLDYLPVKYFCNNNDDSDTDLEGSSKLAVLLTHNTSKQFKWIVLESPLI